MHRYAKFLINKKNIPPFKFMISPVNILIVLKKLRTKMDNCSANITFMKYLN